MAGSSWGSSLPCFLAERSRTGDAALPKQLLRRRVGKAKTLYSRNLVGHFGCVNAIEFSNNGGQFLASGGDDRRVLLWNIHEAMSFDKKFEVMVGEHHSNIFSLAFDSHNSRLYSGGNDDQVLVHDIQRKETVDVFLHEDAVYGLAVDPRDSHIFVSACADGRVLLWDTRVPSHQEPFVIANSHTAFYAVVYHPVEPEFVATANSKEGVALWDIRAPRSSLMRYGSRYTQQNAMSVRFNQFGTRLVALRRRLPPVVYNVHSSVAAVQFNHSGYYNSCTMKSCTFAGDKDQYVLSGSDDFNLYMWEVPELSEDVIWVDEAKMVLQGHRSIVNQVRFNSNTHNIVSSGVEKIIKLWSPFNLPNIVPSEDSQRQMFSHQQYIDLVINSGTALSHDYTDQSMEEDPRMIAFFDSLVQREINRSFSDSDDSDMSPESLYLHFAGEGEDSGDNVRETDSDSSVSSFQASLFRRLVEENGNVSPTSQLRTLWNLGPPSGIVAAENSNAPAANDESNNDSSSDDKLKLPKKTVKQGSPGNAELNQEGSMGDVSGSVEPRQEPESGDAQDKTQGTNRMTSKRKRSRHMPSSSTSSPDTSSSDEGVNFQELRSRSRLLRRFLKKNKKKKPESDGGGDSQNSEPVNNDRFINLRQRMAISRVLKGKIARAEERPRPVGAREEDLARITEHLQQRSMASHQRVSISRMRRRLQQENNLDLGHSLGENSHTLPEPPTHDRILPPAASDQNVASCSTSHHNPTPSDSDKHALTTLPSHSNSTHNSNCSQAGPSNTYNPTCLSFGKTDTVSQLSCLNSNDHAATWTPTTSTEAPHTNHNSWNSANHATHKETDETEARHDTNHRNEFHKFKNQTSKSNRRYRLHKEKQTPEDSDTD